MQDVLDGRDAPGPVRARLHPGYRRLAGGGFQPIAGFSSTRAGWAPVLRARSPDRPRNDLYQPIKGNLRPFASLKVQQQRSEAEQAAQGVGRGISSAARSARRWVGERVEDVERAPGRLEQEIERLYGVPYR